MALDTLNPTATAAPGRGKAREILADANTLTAMRESGKNNQVSVSIHPRLNAHIIETLAKDAANLEGEDGKISLKRNAWSNALRHALADHFGYEYKSGSDLVIAGKRGTAGLVSVFKTTVSSMFELARSVGQLANMEESQIKSLAFEKAKGSVAAHPQLAGVEITDELLEALWSGGDIDVDVDDDDDEEEEEATPQPAAAPTFGA